MLLKSIRLTNFLSYGPDTLEIPLSNLNVIVGPNGSGKSNLIEAIEILKATPQDLLTMIRDGGGIRDWLWKGSNKIPIASIKAAIENPDGSSDLQYTLCFTEVAQRFEISEEIVESVQPKKGFDKPKKYYEFTNGHGILNVKGESRPLQQESIDRSSSILSQRKDPDQYPELTYLGNTFSKICLYREWSFGRYTIPRIPQKADLNNDFLESDGRNIGLVLNKLDMDHEPKQRLLKALNALYDGITDYKIRIEGGTVQVFFLEGRYTIPSTRLSDGTLRYLCLLSILCHPDPPPLICIEEPELGLHPDVIPALAELLVEASQRCQLIVTTHSDILIDSLTDHSESVLVTDKTDTGSSIHRLNEDQLKPWLDKYRLGQLWTRGEIGGTRW